jgi:hypothetical protein
LFRVIRHPIPGIDGRLEIRLRQLDYYRVLHQDVAATIVAWLWAPCDHSVGGRPGVPASRGRRKRSIYICLSAPGTSKYRGLHRQRSGVRLDQSLACEHQRGELATKRRETSHVCLHTDKILSYPNHGGKNEKQSACAQQQSKVRMSQCTLSRSRHKRCLTCQ